MRVKKRLQAELCCEKSYVDNRYDGVWMLLTSLLFLCFIIDLGLGIMSSLSRGKGCVSMINNRFITGVQKESLVFFLENIKSLEDKIKVTQSTIIKQINDAEISIESTPYYCIIKFYYNNFSSNSYDKTIEMQVINKNDPPIVFHMYFKNNILYEFEYFNADSSAICENKLCIGDVVINIY